MQPVLCMVTDRHRWRTGSERALVERVRAAAEAGVHLVQVRETGLDGPALVRLVKECVVAVTHTPARVLVNDRADLALAAGAHGVHLPAAAPPASRLRPSLPPGFLIGRSVHSQGEAIDAASDGGVNFLLFGTVFPTVSKPGRSATGLRPLADVVAAVPIPVLAIGGMTPGRAAAVASTGAVGFAAIGMFAGDDSDQMRVSMRAARSAFDTLLRFP